MIDVKIEASWKDILKNDFKEEYFLNIRYKYLEALRNNRILPHPKLLFNAFNLVPFHKVRVVIIGQDPYHNIYYDKPQAHGLAFSVPKGVPIPPSLANIFKELKRDLNLEMPNNGDLTSWCEQGVLLLNSILSVEIHKPASHKSFGWEKFTDRVIELISTKLENIVFMLWGKFAQSKKLLINKEKHLILQAPHPSPLSHGFIGCGHFSKCNIFLKEKKLNEINWKLV